MFGGEEGQDDRGANASGCKCPIVGGVWAGYKADEGGVSSCGIL